LTNVRAILVAAACAGTLLGASASHAQAPTRTVAQFTQGAISFSQGGRAYTADLLSGRIDVSEELAGEAPIEVRTLYVQFALLRGGSGATPDVTVVLTNADGPRVYEGSDLLAFSVQTSVGGQSTLAGDRRGCTVTLTRLSRSGVQGTARCEGAAGLPVTDVSFTAGP
jgi:hypothetical protein